MCGLIVSQAETRVMVGYRRSELAWKLPLLLTLVFSAALVDCVQLDGDAEVGDVVGTGEAEKAWGAAERIQILGAGASVGLDSGGNAVVVWGQRKLDVTGWEVWSHNYTHGDGWGTAERIDENEVNGVAGPAIAVDADGNAVVVWDQTDGDRHDLWSNRYVPSDGWDAPQLIETDDAGDVFRPQVAMDPSGNAIAVWQQSDGTRYNIWANRHTPGGGWETAERIDANNNASGAERPQVALDSSGNAIAVWQQSDGTRDNIWANRYTPRDGWGVAERIEVDNAGTAVAPDIAVEPNGNAVAVWQQSDGTRDNIWANRYVPGDGWGVAERIEIDDAGNAEHPRVAMDAMGNAVTVWDQFDGASFDIWSNRYVPGGGWGTARRIESNDAGEALRPRIAVNPDGNAVVVWEQFDGTGNTISSNRYTPDGGWGTTERIDPGTGAHGPNVAIAPNGDAMAVWHVVAGWGDPRHGIWSNRLE